MTHHLFLYDLRSESSFICTKPTDTILATIHINMELYHDRTFIQTLIGASSSPLSSSRAHQSYIMSRPDPDECHFEYGVHNGDHARMSG